ncbi:MAG: methylmalonyl-CoA mutase subunit beta [Rhizobiaceae bacterium]
MDAGRLFKEAGFGPVPEERWRALAEKALGGKAFDATLVSRTDDGIRINPIEPASPHAEPRGRVDATRPWSITQRIDDPDPQRANRQARDDVANGATGLAVVFAGAPNSFGFGLPASPDALAAALDGIPLDEVYLRIDPHPASRASADWLLALLTTRRGDPSKLRLSFGIDPSAIFGGTGRLRMSIEALHASLPQSLAHFFAMGVPGVLLEGDGRVFHNAGATEAQELGIALATVVSHLRMFESARQALVYAAPHIGFSLSVDQDQFLSMAKVRALRRLWTRAQEACGIPASPGMIHAETSWRMVTARDPETNILRSTVAAFAAATGGADSVSLLPHSIALGLPEEFARRVARNTQLIIAGESHLDFVADPAAGSGSIEALTEALCEAAWKEFQTIDAEGGALKSLADGRIQARILAAREARAADLREGRKSIVGTTLYPLAKERQIEVYADSRKTFAEDTAVTCESLPPVRLDEMLGASA